jgi:hypothetical protein
MATPPWTWGTPNFPGGLFLCAFPAYAFSPEMELRIKDSGNFGERGFGNSQEKENFLGITKSDMVKICKPLKFSIIQKSGVNL